jgi:intracellular septation protein
MKVLYDLFPLLLFFIAYKFFGIYAATGVAIAASLIQLAYTWYSKKRVEFMQVTTTVLIVVFGSMTLYLHNPIFVKWKPSIINWILAAIFFLSHHFGGKPMVQRVLEEQVRMATPNWIKLSWSWITFFIVIGVANSYVIYHYTTDQWVNFKVFGLTGFSLIFAVYQATFITKHAEILTQEK